MAKRKLISTVYYNQEEILNAISYLYMDGNPFEVDPCYGKGNLYASFPEPRCKFDIEPRIKGVEKADCQNLWMIEDCSVSSILFDPPFLVGGGQGGIMHEAFSSFKTIKDQEIFLNNSLAEFNRILKRGGVLTIKCMDMVSGRKNHFIHITIFEMAENLGYQTEDLFILIARNRVMAWNSKVQEHARKFHSYFWVFRKVEAEK